MSHAYLALYIHSSLFQAFHPSSLQGSPLHHNGHGNAGSGVSYPDIYHKKNNLVKKNSKAVTRNDVTPVDKHIIYKYPVVKVMRFRSRRRGSFGRRVARIARRATRSIHVFRYRTEGITLTAAAVTQLPVLASSDDPDYEVGGDFATACQCEEGAVILNIRANWLIRHANAGTHFTWMLFKNPNAVISTVNPPDLWNNAPTAQMQLLRKNCIAAGQFTVLATNLGGRVPVFIKRKALARIGQLHEDDTFLLAIDNSHATVDGTFSGTMTITVAEN